MVNLNTQEQTNSNVNVSNEAGVNMEKSNNKYASVEIDGLKEEIKQTNSSMRNLEELIRQRSLEQKEVKKPEDIARSIMEDSIVDPEKASKELANFVTQEADKRARETMNKIKAEQEADSAINSALLDAPQLIPLSEDIKRRAATLIATGQSKTITDAISKAASVYKNIIPKKDEPKNEGESNLETDGHVGKTSSNATVVSKEKKAVTLEQEIDNREDIRLSKII